MSPQILRVSLRVMLILTSILCALDAQTRPSFDVASVKPNKTDEAATSLGFSEAADSGPSMNRYGG